MKSRDGTREERKTVIDKWTCRLQEQRGTPFTKLPWDHNPAPKRLPLEIARQIVGATLKAALDK